MAQIVIDNQSNEIIHYVENADFEVSNLVNCGIYVFSVRVFSEYGMNSYPDEVDADGDGFFSDGANTPKEN